MRLAPNSVATVRVARARLVAASFERHQARCGDELELTAKLSASGCDGVVEFHLLGIDNGEWLDVIRQPVKGQRRVRCSWPCRKPSDRWDAKPDVKLQVKLLDAKGSEVHQLESKQGLRIVRPPNGRFSNLIPSKYMTGAQWAKTGPRGSWVLLHPARFSWWCNFDVELRDGTIIITNRIRLVGKDGYQPTPTDLSWWKREIEGYWNGHFDAHRASCGRGEDCDCTLSCCRYRIEMVWELVSAGHHAEAVIHAGKAKGKPGEAEWWYSNNWYESSWHPALGSLVPIRGHEAGHCAGQYDDYDGGATAPGRDPNTDPLPPDSLMGYCGRDKKPQAYHFERWLGPLGLRLDDCCVPIRKRRS